MFLRFVVFYFYILEKKLLFEVYILELLTLRGMLLVTYVFVCEVRDILFSVLHHLGQV